MRSAPTRPAAPAIRCLVVALAGAAALAAATTTTTATAAEYVLAEGAQVNFISTKANRVAEVHHFREVSGRLGSDGGVRVVIDLASVDTAIQIRNERMRKMLFEVSRFPQAVISAQLDPATYEDLAAGEYTQLDVPASLSLHGEEQALTLTLDVVAAHDGSLLVSSHAPVIVNASDFQLASGVEKLREVAGLPSISPAVPVTFRLRFEAAGESAR